MAHAMESRLRPAVEFIPAVAATASALALLSWPTLFLMPEALAQTAAAACAILAAIRTRQGLRVLRYRANLRRLPRYVLKPDKIPVSKLKMFWGIGFEWTQKHSQRLFDTRLPEYAKYLEQGRLYRAAHDIEFRLEKSRTFAFVPRITAANAWWNPVRPLPPVGGNAALHGVGMDDERAVYSDIGERVGHTLVLGTTRVGKTRLEELLVTQDIHRGDVVIVFDPKGDKELLVRIFAEAKRAGRLEDFQFSHLGHPEVSARYNAVANFTRITEVASRVSGQLSAEGDSAAFREFAWRFTNIIARALVALGQTPDFEIIAKYVRNIEPLLVEYCSWWLDRSGPSGWRKHVQDMEDKIDPQSLPMALRDRGHHSIAIVRYIKQHDLYDPVADGLRSAYEYDKTYFDKIVASLLPLLEKLTTGKVSELLSPDYANVDDPRPIIDWMQIIRRRGIVYVGLDALSDAEVAAAVGNSMFADLTSVAGQLYKFGLDYGLPDIEDMDVSPAISVHADEFNEIIGDEFIPLLNKAGGAGFQVTAYTQTWADVEARIGSRAKAEQIGGNFNSLVMLRVKNVRTAEILSDQLPKVQLVSRTAVSGVTDMADSSSPTEFISRNEDRITEKEAPMIEPADIVQLPKGQAFALLGGGKLWKLRIPLPYAGHDPMMPRGFGDMVEQMYPGRFATVSQDG